MIERRPTSSSSTKQSATPETFGRYQLLGLLGQGGMGRLYVAERRGIQGFVKIVALKVILPHLADSTQLREMFLNEARTAAKLEHPNIVVTYELGEVEGKYFIAMEYLPGEDFSAIMARCQGGLRIPLETATALAQQAAQGLHYAHEARDQQGRPIGIVHRDVNPRNVFLTYHGVVKLLDFGVVRRRDGQHSMPGTFKGNFGYCAPEQLDGRPVDRRTDVFCLGIVLWEMLTGVSLFEASTEAKTIDAVRARRVEPPSVLRPEIPKELDDIVLKALSRSPSDRYQSAHDFSEELDAFLLERDTRPSQKSLGRWLESVFGAERASLKKSISQGGLAEGMLEKLAALEASAQGPRIGRSASTVPLPRPRPMWSTSLGEPRRTSTVSTARTSNPAFTTMSGAVGAVGAVPPVLAPPPSKRGFGGVPLVVGGLAVLGIIVLLVVRGLAPSSSGDVTTSQASGTSDRKMITSLSVVSIPAGADVFVDGSPSGLKTPAVLTGLTAGATLQLRLDKEGFAPASQSAHIEAGPMRTLTVTLQGGQGTLKLVGVPKRAAVYLDDVKLNTADPIIPVSAGSHRVRVELNQTVLISRTVDVRPEKETLLKVEGNAP